MNDVKDRIEGLVDEIKQERDELELKLHLAKLDVSEEWEKLQAKLVNFEAKAKEVGSVTADASHDVGAAVKLLGEEIRNGYKKIRNHF